MVEFQRAIDVVAVVRILPANVWTGVKTIDRCAASAFEINVRLAVTGQHPDTPGTITQTCIGPQGNALLPLLVGHARPLADVVLVTVGTYPDAVQIAIRLQVTHAAFE
ncbi:hypothetical protein D3C75_1167580 [compost metagenome]